MVWLVFSLSMINVVLYVLYSFTNVSEKENILAMDVILYVMPWKRNKNFNYVYKNTFKALVILF